ncbi:class I SAM-dependent methyltransferase [Methylocystis rosea]|uniref:Class I SAM-dependent methyltransferase n=1 Tax=Methylocystis rosea TaxID=173366 RepID=A0ABX6ECT4_9HYPH|nr:class I SAM-dependent methyltransferase [Methylocystis rosea]QGM92738.1 class I SAM-dependent methyltransferase [Methylocystis rosea]
MSDTSDSADIEYAKKVQQQLEQYAEGFELHGLPNAYFYWSENFLRPGLNEVYGPIDLNDFYALPFIEGAAGKTRPRFLSIGCGDGANEIALARRLVERGLTDFELVCADLSAPLLERFEKSLDEDLRKFFTLSCVDLNRIDAEIPGSFDGVMASHSLHHIVELERVFAWVKRVLQPGCVFAINDMIGRNGHSRWPEAAVFIQMLWPILGKRQRYHAQLKRLYAQFEDLDCSSSGFEGVRAQDILPLLLAAFSPRKFFAGGGLVDPFIDRGFGFGFDTNNEEDRRLLHFICQLNDALLDNGQITPTLMLAHFYGESGEEKYYRRRSARTSVRDPENTPKWTDHYPPVPVLRG